MAWIWTWWGPHDEEAVLPEGSIALLSIGVDFTGCLDQALSKAAGDSRDQAGFDPVFRGGAHAFQNPDDQRVVRVEEGVSQRIRAARRG